MEKVELVWKQMVKIASIKTEEANVEISVEKFSANDLIACEPRWRREDILVWRWLEGERKIAQSYWI